MLKFSVKQSKNFNLDMYIMSYSNQKGLSLVEIIIVMAIIAVLGAIVFVAINPSKYMAESRDSERESEVLQILNKLHQYFADDNTIADLEASAGAIGECGTSDSNVGTSSVNLASVLVSDYMTEFPVDPADGCDQTDTCYDICKNSSNGTVTLKAPNAEIKEIVVSR